jgi:hypothetical protein
MRRTDLNWRPMTPYEKDIAVALRNQALSSRIPFLQWRFVRNMWEKATKDGQITDKQGALILRMAHWYEQKS